MRYIITLVVLSLSFLGKVQAQALINYQGVARDNKGIAIANQAIALRFEILQGSASGPVVYTDNQLSGVLTNSLGLFSTQIGKSGNLAQVDWSNNGPYFLQVSIDPTGGTNLTVLGTQQIVFVPMALHVPSSYTNNVLTIGAKSYTVGSGVTITQGTGTNVTVSGGPNYTISSTPPVLALTPNNASLSIVGSNTIALPAAVTPTLVQSGIATVTNGPFSYTVSVPNPSFNANTSQLSFGSNNTLITPTLVLLNNTVLYSGTPSNSINLPAGVTVASGSPSVSVSGGPNYIVSVTQPSLALSPNNASLAILGSNTISLPAAVTVSAPASNNLVTVSGGPLNYAVSVPLPTYNGTVLTIGANSTTVSPTLSLTNGTLLAVGSGTTSLAAISPWRQAVGSVTLATSTDNVGINTPGAPTAKLDVYSNAATGTVLKVNAANTANVSPALDVNSDGDIGLLVNNTKSTGIAGKLFATGGIALQVRNNSSSFAALQAQNTSSAAGAYAGYFLGGLSTSGSGTTSGDFAFRAQNSASSDLFVVRNDGNVGIGTNAPNSFLDIDVNSLFKDGIHIRNGRDQVGGSLPLTVDITTSGQTYGTNTHGRILRLANGLTIYDQGMDNAGTYFLTYNNTYSSPYFAMTNSGNIGLGTATPGARLDVQGTVKIADGTQGVGKVLTSDAAGNASWLPVTITTPTTFVSQALVSVNTTPSNFASPLASFTKVYADTKIQVIMQTHLYVNDLVGTNSVIFELKLGSTSASGNSGKVNYFIDNANGLNFQNSMPVTVIAEFTGALPAGPYNVTLSAAANAIGTALGPGFDLGNFGANSLIIKEYR